MSPEEFIGLLKAYEAGECPAEVICDAMDEQLKINPDSPMPDLRDDQVIVITYRSYLTNVPPDSNNRAVTLLYALCEVDIAIRDYGKEPLQEGEEEPCESELSAMPPIAGSVYWRRHLSPTE